MNVSDAMHFKEKEKKNMRTETYTVTRTYYNYNELSADAKEKAKEWYLSGQDPCDLSYMMKDEFSALFPNSKLDVQFSLNYCQGDGLNIYGNLDFKDAIDFCKEELSAEEIKFLKWAADAYGKDIKLPYNQRYCYSLKNQTNLIEDVEYSLDEYKNIKWNILQHFEEVLENKLSALDGEWEETGYKYFYEIEEDEFEELCNINEWEFDEDGNAA